MGSKKKTHSPKESSEKDKSYDQSRFASSAVSMGLSEMTSARGGNVSITEDKMFVIQNMKKKMRQVKDASKEAQKALEKGFKKKESLHSQKMQF